MSTHVMVQLVCDCCRFRGVTAPTSEQARALGRKRGWTRERIPGGEMTDSWQDVCGLCAWDRRQEAVMAKKV